MAEESGQEKFVDSSTVLDKISAAWPRLRQVLAGRPYAKSRLAEAALH
jgi:hypothetical protein